MYWNKSSNSVPDGQLDSLSILRYYLYGTPAMENHVATISVALTYEDLNEKPIPRPENYPDRIDFFDLNSARQITSELVMTALTADLAAHGMELQENIIVSWSAMDISSPPTGKTN